MHTICRELQGKVRFHLAFVADRIDTNLIEFHSTTQIRRSTSKFLCRNIGRSTERGLSQTSKRCKWTTHRIRRTNEIRFQCIFQFDFRFDSVNYWQSICTTMAAYWPTYFAIAWWSVIRSCKRSNTISFCTAGISQTKAIRIYFCHRCRHAPVQRHWLPYEIHRSFVYQQFWLSAKVVVCARFCLWYTEMLG